MQQANINSIRVHAHIEAEEFYRLCDEMGLLVWQDFPLQWGYTAISARECNFSVYVCRKLAIN
jgi:beta-galactosidase/beta-glucuronidase